MVVPGYPEGKLGWGSTEAMRKRVIQTSVVYVL